MYYHALCMDKALLFRCSTLLYLLLFPTCTLAGDNASISPTYQLVLNPPPLPKYVNKNWKFTLKATLKGVKRKQAKIQQSIKLSSIKSAFAPIAIKKLSYTDVQKPLKIEIHLSEAQKTAIAQAKHTHIFLWKTGLFYNPPVEENFVGSNFLFNVAYTLFHEKQKKVSAQFNSRALPEHANKNYKYTFAGQLPLSQAPNQAVFALVKLDLQTYKVDHADELIADWLDHFAIVPPEMMHRDRNYLRFRVTHFKQRNIQPAVVMLRAICKQAEKISPDDCFREKLLQEEVDFVFGEKQGEVIFMSEAPNRRLRVFPSILAMALRDQLPLSDLVLDSTQ